MEQFGEVEKWAKRTVYSSIRGGKSEKYTLLFFSYRKPRVDSKKMNKKKKILKRILSLTVKEELYSLRVHQILLVIENRLQEFTINFLFIFFMSIHSLEKEKKKLPSYYYSISNHVITIIIYFYFYND